MSSAWDKKKQEYADLIKLAILAASERSGYDPQPTIDATLSEFEDWATRATKGRRVRDFRGDEHLVLAGDTIYAVGKGWADYDDTEEGAELTVTGFDSDGDILTRLPNYGSIYVESSSSWRGWTFDGTDNF